MSFWQSVADTVKATFFSHGMMLVYGVLAAIAGAAAWLWSKHPVRWILILVTVGIVLLIALNRDRVPGPADLDPDLPWAFFPPRFLFWILVLTLASLYLIVHLLGQWIRAVWGRPPADEGEETKFEDLETAWDEIQIRLSHAQYDVAKHKVFLLLSTDEGLAASMMTSAGLQFFTQAPVDAAAPIHAYATADGLFLSCAGASSWGRGDGEGAARLDWLCQKLRALNLEMPVLGGLGILFPLEKAASTEVLQGVGALRNDLQSIRDVLQVRCPTIAVFCQHEPDPCFEEFTVRLPAGVRARRCGFSFPATQVFDHAAANKGLGWLVQWFYTWSLKLMTDHYGMKEGNSKLLLMNARLWRDLGALGRLIDTAFSTHSRSEPVLVRGSYVVACGPDPAGHAFVSGLIGGKASKMVADAAQTVWSRSAHEVDRRYRLAALGLGLGCAAIVLPVWFWGIIAYMEELREPHPSWPWLAWTCLGALALTWAAGLLYPWLKGKSPAKPTKQA